MTFETFDVVVVPFPFTDREVRRRRPALVVSSADFNETHDQSILAMITSAAGEWPSDVAIRDWQEAGLSVACKVRLKLFTLDAAVILRTAGALSERDAEAVRGSLVRFLAVDAGRWRPVAPWRYDCDGPPQVGGRKGREGEE